MKAESRLPGAIGSAGDVLDLGPVAARELPFAHVTKERFIREDLYRALCATFPVAVPVSGETVHSWYAGDPAFDRLLEREPAWRTLHEAIQTPEFLLYCLAPFRDTMATHGSLLDPARARLARYTESRHDKKQRQIAQVVLEPEELFIRMDLYQAYKGYRRASHLDLTRRLVSLLVYLCDAGESAMDGGELVLHARSPLCAPWRDLLVVPRHNRMVAFACTAGAYHAVRPIRHLTAPRNYIHILVSSSVDAWPHSASLWRKIVLRTAEVLRPSGCGVRL